MVNNKNKTKMNDNYKKRNHQGKRRRNKKKKDSNNSFTCGESQVRYYMVEKSNLKINDNYYK
jgi:hypothetical protein